MESAAADRCNRLLKLCSSTRIELERPLVRMMNDLTGHRIQPMANRDRTAALPLHRQNPAHQRQQVVSDRAHFEICCVRIKITAGQAGSRKVASKLLDSVLRTLSTLIVKPHHLLCIKPVGVKIRRNRPVWIATAGGTLIVACMPVRFMPTPRSQLPSVWALGSVFMPIRFINADSLCK